jgi:hypothetical protein
LSTGTKIFLVVLVLLAIFYVVGLGMSVHHKIDASNQSHKNFNKDDHPWVTKLENMFPSPSPEFKAAGAGCLSYKDNRMTIKASSDCAMLVSPAKRTMYVIPPPTYRTVKFTVDAGSLLFLHAPGDNLNKGDPDDPQHWNPGNKAVSLSVDRQGGMLVLHCMGPAPCQVSFQ